MKVIINSPHVAWTLLFTLFHKSFVDLLCLQNVYPTMVQKGSCGESLAFVQIVISFFSFCSVFVTRSRAHETLARVNPTAAARRWSLKVARRVYRAPHLNSLLHIDGKPCLMRILLPDLPFLFNIWKILSASVTQNTQHYNHFQVFIFFFWQTFLEGLFLIHGSCSTGNHVTTVLAQFLKATYLDALRSRVRCDHGGANFLVA